jgi:hypothetical protein
MQVDWFEPSKMPGKFLIYTENFRFDCGGFKMNDPKYYPCCGRLMHTEGEYFIPEDEPIMMLRGKDVTSLAAIVAYVKELMRMEDTETVRSHLESSVERLKTIYKYQIENSDKAGVGCSQIWHSTSDEILKRAGDLINEIDRGGF